MSNTRYDYRDGDGRIVHFVIKKPDKTYSRGRTLNGKTEWNWNDIQIVPFNLPGIIQKSGLIFVEGEKDVLTLKGLGIPSSTIPGGSNGWEPLLKRQPDFCRKYFDGKSIIFIPDNDAPGRKFMETGARHLVEGGAEVHVCDLCQGLEPGADITDWVEQNQADKETLLDAIDNLATRWEPKEEPTSILDNPINVSAELQRPSSEEEVEHDLENLFKSVTSGRQGSWSGDTFNTKCPAHEDNKASLSITLKPGGDKILFRCHAGCSFNSICLGLGIKPKETFRSTGGLLKERQAEKIAPVSTQDMEKICKQILESDEPEEFDGVQAPIIGDYVSQVSGLTDAHPVVVYATALSAIGAQAQTKLIIPKGEYYVRLYPNLWFLSVAESGTYKTTALNAGAAPLMERERDLIQNILEVSSQIARMRADGVDGDDPELANLLHEKENLDAKRRKLPDKASWEACIDRIDTSGGGIWTLSEFGAWLSGLEKSYNQGFKQTVTELYDVPDTYEEATRTGGTRILEKPFIAISGVSTMEFLAGLLGREDAATGFLARFMLLRPPVKNAIPDSLPTTKGTERDLESYSLLMEVYRQLSMMTVPLEYTLSQDARTSFDEYHKAMFNRFYSMKEEEKQWMEPFLKRLGPNALKVGMISQFLLDSTSTSISGHAMMAGISLAAYSEICIRFLFKRELGESEFQRKSRKLIAWLAKRDGNATREVLLRSKTLGGGQKEYDYVLEYLEDSGSIVVESERGKWRPGTKISLREQIYRLN